MEQPNLSYIHSMSGGDKAFEEKLIGIIKREFPEERQEYLDNIVAKNYKLAAGNVHKLKHKISILGYEKGYDVAQKFENSLKERTPQKTLQVKFDTLLNDMDDFIANL